MGAIQNSINAAVGAVSGAIVAGKMAEEKFEAEGANLLKEQATLASQAETNTAKTEDMEKVVNELEKKSQDKRLGQKKKDALAHDLGIARQSLYDLKEQQDAIRKLRTMNTQNIEAYRKRGGRI